MDRERAFIEASPEIVGIIRRSIVEAADRLRGYDNDRAEEARERAEQPEDAAQREDDVTELYPNGWPELHNASHDACDMLRGPCVCGAWHRGDDQATKAIVLLLNLAEQAFDASSEAFAVNALLSERHKKAPQKGDL